MASSPVAYRKCGRQVHSRRCRVLLVANVGHTGPGDCLQKWLHALFLQWRDCHRFYRPASTTEGTPHIPPASLYVSASFQFSPAFESPANPYAYQGSSLNNQGNGLPASAFQLKWVQGTTVKKCYGCGGDIQNPPVQRPNDLVVVCRDFRQYRDRMTGQLTRNSTPQNVHFLTFGGNVF